MCLDSKNFLPSCAIPAKLLHTKDFLNFPKTFALNPKVNAIPGKLRFIRRLWIIHLHWVSQLELFFHRTISLTISCKSLPTFESKVWGGEDRMWRQLLRLTAVNYYRGSNIPQTTIFYSSYTTKKLSLSTMFSCDTWTWYINQFYDVLWTW